MVKTIISVTAETVTSKLATHFVGNPRPAPMATEQITRTVAVTATLDKELKWSIRCSRRLATDNCAVR